MKKQPLLIATGVFIGAAMMAAAAWITRGAIPDVRYQDTSSSNAPQSISAPSTTNAMEGSGGDYGNPRWFMGEYSNVFVGKVNQVVGEKTVVGIRVIEFSVRPLYNIKGRLTDSIILTSANLSPHPMLAPGKTFVIGARYDASDGTYSTGASIYSFVVVSDDEAASDAELIAVAKRNPRVIELQNAYPCEIVSAPDAVTGGAYNAYATRCLDASGNLIDDTVQATNEMKGLSKSACVTRLVPEACRMQTPTPTVRPEFRVTPLPEGFPPPPTVDMHATPEPTLKPPPAVPGL
jgi:hypothetical protein